MLRLTVFSMFLHTNVISPIGGTVAHVFTHKARSILGMHVLMAQGNGLWVKTRRQLEVEDFGWVVNRTFLSLVPKSTTAADSPKGPNPRCAIGDV